MKGNLKRKLMHPVSVVTIFWVIVIAFFTLTFYAPQIAVLLVLSLALIFSVVTVTWLIYSIAKDWQ
jgi:uncharacterized membrane protein